MAGAEKSLLRFITCGSVDDGKSTLIGRLLYDSRLVFDDQLEALERDTRKHGTTGEKFDLALLVDGLQAEREQAITIDVAYRFFATEKRKFIVADTPGHVQYTRNMATGASTASLAVLLIDARKGILTQTRRHAAIVALLGIRSLVLAVNKMDLIGFDERRFAEIVETFREFAAQLGVSDVTAIPVSALRGDNVARGSDAMPWYRGPALLPFLEEVEVETDPPGGAFRMPVQWVNRANLDFRGYAGMIARGSVQPGDSVVIEPSGRTSRIARVVFDGADRDAAAAGEAVTVTLADEIDVSRGDVLCSPQDRPLVSDQVAANVIWLHDEPMLPGRPYLLRAGTAQAVAQVTELKHKINVDSLEHQAAKTLTLNEIGVCNLSFDRALALDPYKSCRECGSFILIDRVTNLTVGAGMVEFSLRRAANIVWQPLSIDKRRRSEIKGQKPCVLWFTGLSGAGKSTIANLLEKRLVEAGRHTYMLDGDNVRHGLNKDLGFTDADRVENIRRVAETAKLMVDAGLIVVVSFISPFRSERRMARELMESGEFLEVYVNTPIEVCEDRDPKGLYRKARRGEIANFTGIDSPYEPPDSPDLVIDGRGGAPEVAVEELVREMRARGLIVW
ncbi:MAG TPA: sulfate adenylyltransferase subunit CysN [Stellaceae bacterium]|nr:sulfate adenylyltransferase subunit CysN [Stellaceae bacterium]